MCQLVYHGWAEDTLLFKRMEMGFWSTASVSICDSKDGGQQGKKMQK